MIFRETSLVGAFVIEIERNEDERGFFARTWSKTDLETHGLSTKIVQCSVSLNHRRGTLRGIHYQVAPFEEVKIVRCTRGAIYDVIVDLRRGSKTYLKWFAVELTAQNHTMLYVPAGVAHGFLTTMDATEVYYEISEEYSPDHARGVRWNDPLFGIQWPVPVTTISERDRTCPDFEPRRGE